MATTTTPEVKPQEKKTAPVSLTPNAIAKVKQIMAQQNPAPAGLRVGVVGGGCSGFSYSMQFENASGLMDKVFDMDGLKVYVDATIRGRHLSHVPERLRRRLRRNSGGRRVQIRKSKRQEHLRMRIIFQRLRVRVSPISEGLIAAMRPFLLCSHLSN